MFMSYNHDFSNHDLLLIPDVNITWASIFIFKARTKFALSPVFFALIISLICL